MTQLLVLGFAWSFVGSARAQATTDATVEEVSDSLPDSVRHVVRVTSTPEGAVISVDGEQAGIAPVEVELDTGTHEIRGTLDGHEDDHRHVEVPGPLEVDLSLVPIVPLPPPRVRYQPSVLNYVLAATFLAGGIAVATGPLITTIRAGECATACDDPSEAERYEVGTQTVVWLSVSAAIFAAALVFALARPIRTRAAFTRQSAHFSLEASF